MHCSSCTHSPPAIWNLSLPIWSITRWGYNADIPSSTYSWVKKQYTGPELWLKCHHAQAVLHLPAANSLCLWVLCRSPLGLKVCCTLLRLLHYLLTFLHRGPVPDHPEGVWSCAGATLPDSHADLFLLWLLSEHFWYWYELDPPAPREGSLVAGKHMVRGWQALQVNPEEPVHYLQGQLQQSYVAYNDKHGDLQTQPPINVLGNNIDTVSGASCMRSKTGPQFCSFFCTSGKWRMCPFLSASGVSSPLQGLIALSSSCFSNSTSQISCELSWS
jgi:hypothetical protein